MALPMVTSAQTSKDWTYSASVKMWNQNMTVDDGTPVSNTAITPILGLSARRGEWFGVLSFFPKTNFAFWEYQDDGSVREYSDGREEYDIAVGYSLSAVPGLSVLVGYKDIVHGEGTDGLPAGYASSDATFKAPILGISYTRSISESVYLFSSVATNVGGTQELKVDWIGDTEINALKSTPDYKTAEIGIGTVLDNGVTVGLGWRYQKLTLNLKDEVARAIGRNKFTEKGDGVTLTVGFAF